MDTGENRLSNVLKFVFWFVVANSTVGALSLILFSTQTEKFFFWNITPPLNAMLVGTMYFVAGIAVAYAAWRGTWEATRIVAVMGFSLSVVLFAVTLIHIDRFVPGVKLSYWLFVYFIFPASVAFMYWRYEKGGANWKVTQQEVKAQTRLTALVMGFGLLFFALVGLFVPSLIISFGLWKTSELMVRVFSSWFMALAMGNLWFWVEKEWTRVQVLAFMLIATPFTVAIIMFVNRSDIIGGSFKLSLFSVALALMASTGGFMLWRQRNFSK